MDYCSIHIKDIHNCKTFIKRKMIGTQLFYKWNTVNTWVKNQRNINGFL